VIGVIYAAFRRVGNTRIYCDLVFYEKFLAVIELGRLKEYSKGSEIIPSTYEKQLLTLQKRRLRSQYRNEAFIKKLRDLKRVEFIRYDEIDKVQICTFTLSKISTRRRSREEHEQVLRMTFILKNLVSITYYTSVKLRDYVKSLLRELRINYESC